MHRNTLVALAFAVTSAVALSASAQTPPGQTTPPKPSTTAGQPPAKSSGSADLMFVNNAAIGGLAEVELGKLATQKAENAEVKQFGQRMVDDHGKANDELTKLAQSKNITLPKALTGVHKTTYDRLNKLNGAAFDRAYMRDMLRDHVKDVNEFEKESKSGKDSDVKSWATDKLPTLKDHLATARQINEKMGAGTSGTKKPAAKKPGGHSGR